MIGWLLDRYGLEFRWFFYVLNVYLCGIKRKSSRRKEGGEKREFMNELSIEISSEKGRKGKERIKGLKTYR